MMGRVGKMLGRAWKAVSKKDLYQREREREKEGERERGGEGGRERGREEGWQRERG